MSFRCTIAMKGGISMSRQSNPYPLRLSPEVERKGKFMAKDSGRSFNKEIEELLKQKIKSYESEYGVIQTPDEPQP